MKSVKEEIAQIAAKMDSLGLWRKLVGYNWAVKPKGSAVPYFCTIYLGDGNPLKARVLMLEGWLTMHYFVAMKQSPDYGFISSDLELPHFDVAIEANDCKVYRFDYVYAPTVAEERHLELVKRMLWECYGVMMRLENDETLPMKFAEDRCVFARVETEKGKWVDQPLKIPEERPMVEKISFDQARLKKANDLIIEKKVKWAVDFGLEARLTTKEKRPRMAYRLWIVNAETAERIIVYTATTSEEDGIKGLWEHMPGRLMNVFLEVGYIPGEIQVPNGRMFRFLRPLAEELPFKLSLHTSLDVLKKVKEVIE